MIRTIYNKVDKAFVSSLPIERFEGRIILIISDKEVDKAVDYLQNQEYVGIDTETRPSFKKKCHNTISLLQISTHDTCFLFRLKRIESYTKIKSFLENQKVTKVGLSLNDDIHALNEIMPFTPSQFVDLQQLIGKIGIEDKSLQKIYANLFNKRISKTQQLSNWDADILSEKQMIYGATDAWACIKIYEEFTNLYTKGNYKLKTNTTDNNE